MRKTLIVAGVVLSILAGCQQFFTTSVATILARPPATITTLTAASAASFADNLASNPDPAIAKTALPALKELVDPKNHPSAAVVGDAAAVAVVATGLDKSLTEAITSISDVNALLTGTATLSSDDQKKISDIVTLASQNVDANTTAIFTALATATPADLASNGVGAQTLVVAAAALALNDMSANLPAGKTVADVMSGGVTYTPSSTVGPLLTDLAAGALAIDPTNALLGTLKGLLKF